jgi:hypothetical protein
VVVDKFNKYALHSVTPPILCSEGCTSFLGLYITAPWHAYPYNLQQRSNIHKYILEGAVPFGISATLFEFRLPPLVGRGDEKGESMS